MGKFVCLEVFCLDWMCREGSLRSSMLEISRYLYIEGRYHYRTDVTASTPKACRSSTGAASGILVVSGALAHVLRSQSGGSSNLVELAQISPGWWGEGPAVGDWPVQVCRSY